MMKTAIFWSTLLVCIVSACLYCWHVYLLKKVANNFSVGPILFGPFRHENQVEKVSFCRWLVLPREWEESIDQNRADAKIIYTP